MNLKKSILLISLFIFICAVLLLLFGYLFLSRSLPEDSGTVHMESLEQQVKICRDEWGVPSITAASDRDLFTALGFVIAHDRLWQIELYRRAATGTLSEVLGPDYADCDRLVRTLNLITSYDSSLMYDILDAYITGINDCIKQKTSKRSIQFHLVKIAPTFWQVKDCILVIRLLEWLQHSDWKYEILCSDVRAALKSDPRYRSFLSATPDKSSLSATERADFLADVRWIDRAVSRLRLLLGLPVHGGMGDSRLYFPNVSTPILFTEIDQAPVVTSPFYLVSLQSARILAMGMTLPGFPGLICGRNEKMAWGPIDELFDLNDLEIVSSRDSVTARFEKIDIRRQKPLYADIFSSGGDPLFIHKARCDTSVEWFWRMKWTGKNQSVDVAAGVYNLLSVEFCDDLKQPLNQVGCFIACDVDGNHVIGYPDNRRQFFEKQSPYHRVKPQVGQSLMVTAAPESRHEEWDTNAEARSRLVYDLETRVFVERSLVEIFTFYRFLVQALSENEFPPGSAEAAAFVTIKDWNLVLNRESVAASIVLNSYAHFCRLVLSDLLGNDLCERVINVRAIRERLVNVLWQNPQSLDFIKNRSQLLLTSFLMAIGNLTIDSGADMGNWYLGAFIRSDFISPEFCDTPFSRFFDFGDTEMGPSSFTFTPIESGKDIDISAAPVAKQIVDLSKPTLYKAVLPTGQTAHPLHRHYNDMWDVWKQRKMIQFSMRKVEDKKEQRIFYLVPEN